MAAEDDETRTPAEVADEALALSVAAVWREERVSCPHPQILAAYRTGSLPAGATEFLDFHLQESGCPYCASVIEDLAAEDEGARTAELESMRDRILRSTVTELRRSKPR